MAKLKAVLITGCNGGIGVELCEEFKGADYIVIGTDLHNTKIANCDYYINIDLTDLLKNDKIRSSFYQSVNNFVASKEAKFQALINNAAYQIVKPLSELTELEFQSVQTINVTAPFILSRLFDSDLRKSRGSIINIGSIHSILTKPEFCAYSTSKAGLSGLTRALALEFSGEVTVNSILPAATKTTMLQAGFKEHPEKFEELESYHPAGRIADPKEIAYLALFLCSEMARFINASEIPIDGGIGARLHDPL